MSGGALDAAVGSAHEGRRRERPGSAAEVAAVLADCAREGLGVVPIGEGLAMGACGAPARFDVALEMAGVTGIVACESGDLTLTARAGTPLAEIAAVLAPLRLQLPGAPQKGGTFGGLLACGWSVPGSLATHGRLRDRVLGMEVASPDGMVTRSGGRVVKNVAGFDLHRMHAGACGAFGVITESCVRLEPMPETSRAIVLEAPTVEAVEGAWKWLRMEGPDPSAIAIRLARDGARAVVVFAGDDETVEAMRAATAAGWAKHGQVRDAPIDSTESRDALDGPLAAPREGLSFTISDRPSRVIRRLSWLRDQGAGVELDAAGYPGLGAVHVAATGPRDALGNLWETVARATRDGAHFRIEGVPSGLRRATPSWSADPSALRMLARLKHEFDPAGTLRPGSWSVDALQAAAEYFGVTK
jgi:glycolate oxidase FAD binding subunit